MLLKAIALITALAFTAVSAAPIKPALIRKAMDYATTPWAQTSERGKITRILERFNIDIRDTRGNFPLLSILFAYRNGLADELFQLAFGRARHNPYRTLYLARVQLGESAQAEKIFRGFQYLAKQPEVGSTRQAALLFKETLTVNKRFTREVEELNSFEDIIANLITHSRGIAAEQVTSSGGRLTMHTILQAEKKVIDTLEEMMEVNGTDFADIINNRYYHMSRVIRKSNDGYAGTGFAQALNAPVHDIVTRALFRTNKTFSDPFSEPREIADLLSSDEVFFSIGRETYLNIYQKVIADGLIGIENLVEGRLHRIFDLAEDNAELMDSQAYVEIFEAAEESDDFARMLHRVLEG